MSLFDDLVALFIPPRCPVCGATLDEGEQAICKRCRFDAPLTGQTSRADNAVFERFWGIVPIERACALFYFVPESGWRRMIHDFKYRGAWRIAEQCGEWFGGELRRGGLYADVDVVVPVPLHPIKTMRRGYNQSEYIALGIAHTMDIELSSGNVVRRRYNRSQALRPRRERWANVEGIFDVRRPDELRGRHILLVDDVLTTGATITSCAEAIFALVPDVRVSIATLAVAHDELE